VVRRASIGATLVFPAVAAACPELIPALFGEPWRDAADALPFVCLSTLVLGSIAVGASSYLNAAGRPGVVAKATASFGVVWVALTAALLPTLGVAAIGIANLCGALVEAAVLDRATFRSAGVAPHRPMLKPLAVAIPSGILGWMACVTAPPGLVTALGAGALTVGLCCVGLSLVCRSDFKDTLRLGAGAMRSAMSR
jgi:O-antigen/teichoic acid export membrane protein